MAALALGLLPAATPASRVRSISGEGYQARRTAPLSSARAVDR